ncbi:putative ceramide glucosyltransferase [Medicago truncatula]|uniref:ceramide glucosyltransferase n=1 Tax=Medicago truncatula TaxID=3880 RepID=A0A396GR29_MEDTR|nr:putative ceramide glucosyltransferase [Medicago truncatula]
MKDAMKNGNSLSFLCHDINELEHSYQANLPRVTVITTLYGGPIEFIFVLESTEDPAYHPISRLISEFEDDVDVRIVVAGISTTCSQSIGMVGVEKMHKDTKYVLFSDDDVRIHPGSIGALTREMEKNPEIFIQTGYPLDLPSRSLWSYCIYEYHMPCSMGFDTSGRTFFLWGGCMMASTFCLFLVMHADDFRQDRYGVVSGLKDGGYFDDMTLAAIAGTSLFLNAYSCAITIMLSFAGAHKRLITSPPLALFPHPLATDLNFGRYWNYLRKQTFALESYTTNINWMMNRALSGVHCYVSWALVASFLMAMIHLAAVFRFYSKGYSLEEMAYSAAVWVITSDLPSHMYFCGTSFNVELDKDRRSSTMQHVVFIALLVNNILYPLSAIKSHFSQSINWSGIRYYLKHGKVIKIERTERSKDMSPIFTDLGGKHLYGKERDACQRFIPQFFVQKSSKKPTTQEI